jgi:hypothetical protein
VSIRHESPVGAEYRLSHGAPETWAAETFTTYLDLALSGATRGRSRLAVVKSRVRVLVALSWGLPLFVLVEMVEALSGLRWSWLDHRLDWADHVLAVAVAAAAAEGATAFAARVRVWTDTVGYWLDRMAYEVDQLKAAAKPGR